MYFHQIVREFCIRKLARILYDCLGYSHSDRALADWQTAKEFVTDNHHIVNLIAKILELRMLTQEPACDFETFDRICGRDVWDGMYQPLQKLLKLPYRPMSSESPTPHYTHIRFD